MISSQTIAEAFTKGEALKATHPNGDKYTLHNYQNAKIDGTWSDVGVRYSSVSTGREYWRTVNDFKNFTLTL